MEIPGGFDSVGHILKGFNRLSDKELHSLEWSVTSVEVWDGG